MRKFIVIFLMLIMGTASFGQEPLIAKTTAYCNGEICTSKEPGDFGYSITSSGISTLDNPYVVAGHPDVFPEGSIIYVRDLGFRLVADTGTFIHWEDGKKRLDIYMEDHRKAWDYGVKNKEVYFVRKGWDNWQDLYLLDHISISEAMSEEVINSRDFLKTPFYVLKSSSNKEAEKVTWKKYSVAMH